MQVAVKQEIGKEYQRQGLDLGMWCVPINALDPDLQGGQVSGAVRKVPMQTSSFSQTGIGDEVNPISATTILLSPKPFAST